MNGMTPKFLESQTLGSDYYATPDPYKTAPSCHVNLLKLSRYAKKVGKAMTDLTRQEVEQFRI